MVLNQVSNDSNSVMLLNHIFGDSISIIALKKNCRDSNTGLDTIDMRAIQVESFIQTPQACKAMFAAAGAALGNRGVMI